MDAAVTLEELVARFQQGDELMFEQLLKRCHALLQSAVTRFVRNPRCDYFEDVWQSARIGLYQAAKSFDAARGYKFITYAPWRVSGVIRDMLRMEGTIRLTRTGSDKAKLNGGYRVDRLETKVGDHNVVIGDLIADHRSRTPVYEMIGIDDTDTLFQAIAKLPAVPQLVLLARLEGHTMKEAAARVGLGESRISQLMNGYLLALGAVVQAQRSNFKPNCQPLSEGEQAYIYLVRKTREPEVVAADLRRSPECIRLTTRSMPGALVRNRGDSWRRTPLKQQHRRAVPKQKIA